MMNAEFQKNCLQFVEILTCHRADPEEIDDIMAVLSLAHTDPEGFIDDYPDDAWLVTVYGLQGDALSEALFKLSLPEVMEDFCVIGDKADEIHEALTDFLDDMDIELDPPEVEIRNWFYLAHDIEVQLARKKTAKRIIAFDVSFSDNMSVFVVEAADYDRALNLALFFKATVIEPPHSSWSPLIDAAD